MFVRLLLINIISIIISLGIGHAQLSTIDNTSPSITQSLEHVVDTTHIKDPLREGSMIGIKSPNGTKMVQNLLHTEKITWFDQAKHETLLFIKKIINIILGFVATVVFFLLLVEGYKINISANDSTQYEKALQQLKNYAIAIGGIAISWLIITFIFAAVNLITS